MKPGDDLDRGDGARQLDLQSRCGCILRDRGTPGGLVDVVDGRGAVERYEARIKRSEDGLSGLNVDVAEDLQSPRAVAIRSSRVALGTSSVPNAIPSSKQNIEST